MMEKLNIETKTNNLGASHSGKIFAWEFNNIVSKINDIIDMFSGYYNKDSIDGLTYTKTEIDNKIANYAPVVLTSAQWDRLMSDPNVTIPEDKIIYVTDSDEDDGSNPFIAI